MLVFQFALAPTLTAARRTRGAARFLGGSGRDSSRISSIQNSWSSANLLTQNATAASVAAAQEIVLRVKLPYANFSGTIAQMLRPFPQYSGVTDVYGRRRVVHLSFAAAHGREATVGRRADGELQLHVQRTEDNPRRRTGYNFDQAGPSA